MVELKSKRKHNYKIWTYELSEATEILAAERLILSFMHGEFEDEYDTRSIKDFTLYDFREYIQKKKDSLDVQWASE